jgi:Flavodoxins
MFQVEDGPCHNVLVTYFSHSGNTRSVAQLLREKTCGVLYGVEPRKIYSKRNVIQEAVQEIREGHLPPLKHAVPTMYSYDYVLVGGPVWEDTLPSPLMSFLRDADFKGKKVAAFCIHDGNPGTFLPDFKNLARNADILDGLELPSVRRNTADALETTLSSWLAGLGLVKPLATAV